jgi:hypothetical protein
MSQAKWHLSGRAEDMEGQGRAADPIPMRLKPTSGSFMLTAHTDARVWGL